VPPAFSGMGNRYRRPTSQGAMAALCVWEGNRRSGVASQTMVYPPTGSERDMSRRSDAPLARSMAPLWFCFTSLYIIRPYDQNTI